MDVQNRNLGLGLAVNQFATAKGDDEGRVEVVGSISPAPAVNESFTGSGYASQSIRIGAASLMKLYVGLNAPLIGSGPFYVIIADGVTLSPGDSSVIPTPPMTTAGSFFYWEPPGGAKFSTGIAIAISSTPLIYASTSELCAVSLWTAP